MQRCSYFYGKWHIVNFYDDIGDEDNDSDDACCHYQCHLQFF